MPYLQCALEKQCYGVDSTHVMSHFTASFSTMFLLLNIPGNLMVILAVTLNPYKNLRTPFNYLMANLAFADLIVGTVTEPMSIYIHWKEAHDGYVTQEEATVLHMSYFISCTASVVSLGTLAVERYLAIRKPHTYRNEFTTKRVIATAVLIWVFSIGLSCVYFEVGYVTYAFIFVNTAVALTIGIICFMYYLMLRALKQRARCDTPKPIIDNITEKSVEQNLHKVGNQVVASLAQKSGKWTHKLHKNEPKTCSHHQSSGELEYKIEGLETGSNHYQSTSAKWEHKITKRFLVVLIALLCCYGPSTIFIYTMTFCQSCSCTTLHWLRDLQFLFVVANSSVNFFCYALRSSRFRKAFARILRLKSRKMPVGERMTESSTDIMNL